MAAIQEEGTEVGTASIHRYTMAPQVKTAEVSCDEKDGVGPNTSVPPISSTKQLVERFWLWEIFALAASIVGLLGIVAILKVTESHVVPSWSKTTDVPRMKQVTLTVTINSVISIFSTLVKSTVLIPVVAAIHELKWMWFANPRSLADIQVFSDAADGPLGSAKMLWSHRGKTLSCLGAVIIVSSLSLDFALQQLVTFPLEPTYNGTVALVAWRTGQLTSLKSVELPMLAAIYKGLYSDGLNFTMTPYCPSGNCNWTNQYTSLGVCSRCYSTTDQIQKSCGESYVPTNSDGDGPSLYSQPVSYCNYTLPGPGSGTDSAGLGIIGGYPNGTLNNSPITTTVLNQVSSNETYFGQAINGSQLVAHLASFSVMRASWTDIFDNSSVSQIPPYYRLDDANATECGIDLCVIKYQGSVDASTFTETIVDTFINTTDYNEGTTEQPVPTIVPPARWTNLSDDNDQNLFSMDPFTYRAIITSLSDTLKELSGNYYEAAGAAHYDTDFVAYVHYTNDASLSQMMSSLAQSMTQRMRQAPGEGASLGPGPNANGTTYYEIPHVNVRWGWITIPLTIVILTAVFLFSTLYQARRADATMLWKGSSLAGLSHPLTKHGRDQLQSASSAKHADKIAGTMRVQWEQIGAGGRLVAMPL